MNQSTSNKLALWALASIFFVVGVAEFISVGVLPSIADYFQESTSSAGRIVSFYALGAALGSPFIMAFTSTIKRRTVLLGSLILFILGNLITAMAPNFSILLTGRITTALSHGVMFAIATLVATMLVAPNKQAAAIAFLFSGLTIATTLGAPFGTFISDHLGWRLPFFGIAALGLITLLANTKLLPTVITTTTKPATLKEQISLLGNPRLLLVMLTTLIGYGGTFATYTYLSPILQSISHISAESISPILVLYGIALAIGNTIGGKVGNEKPLQALLVIFILQALALGSLWFTAPYPLWAILSVLAFGLFAFMNVAPLQTYLLILARREVPHAVDTASSLNISAFNGGIVVGASIGGFITDTIGLIHTPWVAAAMVAIAAVLTVALLRQEERYFISTDNPAHPCQDSMAYEN